MDIIKELNSFANQPGYTPNNYVEIMRNAASTIKRQEQEVLKLHRDLAAEKLRADQGWHRYEAANSRKNELEAERANWTQEIAALKSRPSTQSHVYDWLTLVEKKIGTPTASAAAHVLKDFYEGAEIDQSQLSIQMREQDAEQFARSKWAVKQWYEHVGAWENSQGEVCFGSVMALGAMLKLMAKARNSAAPVTPQNAIDSARKTLLLIKGTAPQYDHWTRQDQITWEQGYSKAIEDAVKSLVKTNN